MRPILFEIFGVTFPSYYTMLTVGFLLIAYLGQREAKRVGVNPDDFLDMTFWMFVFGLIGARLLHVFADGYFFDYINLCLDPLKVEVPSFIHVSCAVDADCVSADAGALCHPEMGRCFPAQDCLAPLKFWQGGLAFYGGLIMAVAYAVYFIRKRKMAVSPTFDIAGWGIALGLGFGRLGCFLAGCCFGQITDAPTALQFKGYMTPTRGCAQGQVLIKTEGEAAYCVEEDPALIKRVRGGEIEPKERPIRVERAPIVFDVLGYVVELDACRRGFAPVEGASGARYCVWGGPAAEALAAADAIPIGARINAPPRPYSCPKNYDLIEGASGRLYCAFGRPAFIAHVKQDLLPPKSKLSRPVHATQLYELAFSWSIFAWLYFWRRRRARYGGQLFVEFALLYGIGRFTVEFFRADDRGLWLGELLSTSQLIALPFIFGALYLMWRWRDRRDPPPPSAPASSEAR